MFESHFFRRWWHRLIVEARAIEGQQFRLGSYRQLPVFPVDQPAPLFPT
jgi:hypothetical protein